MKLSRLFEEFRRRRVFRVAAAFAVVAWIAVQVADIAFDAFEFPDWALQLLIIAAVLGFLVAIALAWAFDVEPEGIRRTRRSRSDLEGASTPSTVVDRGARPLPSRRGLLWLAAAGVAVALGVVALVDVGNDDVAEDLARTRIAVFPFSYRGSEELAYLREGVVDLLSTKLNGTGELTTVDPNALLARLGEVAGTSIETSKHIAREFGAGTFITGTILEAGGGIEIHAMLHDAGGDVENEESARTSETELLEALDRLARALVAERFERESAEMERLAALTTSSTTALKSFLEGEAAFRRGDAEGARALFEAATEEDSTFALAHYRLSVAGSWFPRSRADFEQVRAAMHAADRHADRLSQPSRQILAAYLAYQGGQDSPEAIRLMRSLVRTHPDNAEAWYMLGEALLHAAGRRGRDMGEAREAFERTVDLDPRQTFSLLHLADIAAHEGDVAALDSIHRRMQTGAPERALLVDYYRLMLRDEDPAAVDSMRDAAVAMEPAVLTEVFWRGAATARSPAGLQILADQLFERGEGFERRYGVRASAGLAAARGRPTAMLERLPEVGVIGDGRGGAPLVDGVTPHVKDAAYLLAMPFLPPRPGDVRVVLDGLPGAGTSSSAAADAEGTYLSGLLSLRLGDHPAAERALSRLSADTAAEAAYYHAALEAHLAWSRSDAAGTVQRLAERGSLAQMERYLFAEALAVTGRVREAIDWFGTFPDYSTTAALGIAFHPPAALRRAELLEELGDVKGAKWQYAEFLEWWDDADPELQDVVQDAREHLRNLVAR